MCPHPTHLPLGPLQPPPQNKTKLRKRKTKTKPNKHKQTKTLFMEAVVWSGESHLSSSLAVTGAPLFLCHGVPAVLDL